MMNLTDDELRALRQKAKDAIDAAYWRFCRQDDCTCREDTRSLIMYLD